MPIASPSAFVPSHVASLDVYQPGKPIEELEREYGITGAIKVASNENPLGPSPLGMEALEAAARQVHLYPDATSHHLIQKLAAFLGVRPEEVFVGNSFMWNPRTRLLVVVLFEGLRSAKPEADRAAELAVFRKLSEAICLSVE